MDRIGALRELVLIQQPTASTDAQGGRSVTWSPLESVYAEYLPMKADEKLDVDSIGSAVTARLRIRRRDDVTPRMRIEWRPSWLPDPQTLQQLEIHGVMPDAADPYTYLILNVGEIE